LLLVRSFGILSSGGCAGAAVFTCSSGGGAIRNSVGDASHRAEPCAAQSTRYGMLRNDVPEFEKGCVVFLSQLKE